MTADASDRRLVHDKLIQLAGPREADLMMEMFSNTDVSSQMALLRAELHIELAELRTETIDRLAAIRTDVTSGLAEVERKMDERFVGVDAKFAGVDARFADMDLKFAGMDVKFAEVDRKIDVKFAEVQASFATMNTTLAEAMARNERAMRFQLIWLVGTMVSIAAVTIALLR